MPTEITFLPSNDFVQKLVIKGAKDQDEAVSIAETWSEEHNCLFRGITQVTDNESTFIADVCSDDYD